MPVGDASLIGRPLSIQLFGLYPVVALNQRRNAVLPLGVDLDVMMPSPGPWLPQPLKFSAWGFRRAKGWNQSPPIRFTFPTDWTEAPVLMMKVTDASGRVVTYRAEFSVDSEAGRPKLQTGVYLLGLRGDSWTDEGSLVKKGASMPARRLSVLMAVSTASARG